MTFSSTCSTCYGWLASVVTSLTKVNISKLKKKHCFENWSEVRCLRLHCTVQSISLVLMLRYCANLKVIRYESMSLSRIVADKSHSVIVALIMGQTIESLWAYSI